MAGFGFVLVESGLVLVGFGFVLVGSGSGFGFVLWVQGWFWLVRFARSGLVLGYFCGLRVGFGRFWVVQGLVFGWFVLCVQGWFCFGFVLGYFCGLRVGFGRFWVVQGLVFGWFCSCFSCF